MSCTTQFTRQINEVIFTMIYVILRLTKKPGSLNSSPTQSKQMGGPRAREQHINRIGKPAGISLQRWQN